MRFAFPLSKRELSSSILLGFDHNRVKPTDVSKSCVNSRVLPHPDPALSTPNTLSAHSEHISMCTYGARPVVPSIATPPPN